MARLLRIPSSRACSDIIGNTDRYAGGSVFCINDFYGQKQYRNIRSDEVVEISSIKPHAGTILKLEVDEGQEIATDYNGHYLM